MCCSLVPTRFTGVVYEARIVYVHVHVDLSNDEIVVMEDKQLLMNREYNYYTIPWFCTYSEQQCRLCVSSLQSYSGNTIMLV